MVRTLFSSWNLLLYPAPETRGRLKYGKAVFRNLYIVQVNLVKGREYYEAASLYCSWGIRQLPRYRGDEKWRAALERNGA